MIIDKSTRKKTLLLSIACLFIIGLWLFFSYKLLEVPPGITSDESAFGYNGVLLARTYHDENGRFMPFFVLSLNGKDWRQPVTQYSVMIAFKIFGSSFYVLRSVSVFMMVLSSLLIFYLLYKIRGLILAIFGTVFFVTTPILMIQSHMALDNIAPVPFVILWLLGIYLFTGNKNLKYLILSGIALGISFYSYKAMRIIVPVWCILTVVYLGLLILSSKLNVSLKKRRLFSWIATFSISILPFFLIIPILESKYSGAVFDRQSVSLDSYQNFFYGFIANLDFSFLFISGDSTPYHSVDHFGALLLSSLSFFLIGIYQSIRRKGYWLFVLVAFFTTPLLFGLANSIYRASRLLALSPMFAIIAALGANTLWEYRNTFKRDIVRRLTLVLLFILLAFSLFNYYDFINYYWNKYATYYQTSTSFPTNSHQSYLILAKESEERQLTPYIEDSIYKRDDVAAQFFEQTYFKKPLTLWNTKRTLSNKAILLTNLEYVPGMKLLDEKLPAYHILISE